MSNEKTNNSFIDMEIRVSFDEVLNWKKAFRFILFSIFISLKINAQYTGEQFGEIDEETIKSRVSEIDSSFDAEILFEERKYGPINSIDAKEFEEFVFKRLKIYRPSGYKHANFVVKYFDPNRWDRQEIEDLKVSVYNWTNNSIVKSKINSSDFVIEDISSGIKQIKVLVPYLKEGSVVDFSYRVHTPIHMINGMPPEWEFQEDIYKRRSVNQVILSSMYGVTFTNDNFSLNHEESLLGFKNKDEEPKFHTMNGFSEELNIGKVHRRIVLDSIPAYNSRESAIGKMLFNINFSSYLLDSRVKSNDEENIERSWSDIDLRLSSINQGIWGIPLIKEMRDIIKDVKNEKDSLLMLQMVKESLNKKLKTQPGSYGNTQEIAKLFENGVTDYWYINAIYTQLISRLKFQVYPLYFNSKKMGAIDLNQPKESDLNDLLTIVKVNNKWLFIDASDTLNKMGDLSSAKLSEYGRIVSDNFTGFVKIDVNQYSSVYSNSSLSINTDTKKIFGTNSTSYSNIAASNKRYEFAENGISTYIENFKNGSFGEVEDLKVSNYLNIQKPVSETFKFSLEIANWNENFIYIQPILNRTLLESGLTCGIERNNPIEFDSKKNITLISNLEIPKGWVVDGMPVSAVISTPNNNCKLILNYTLSNGKVVIACKLVQSQMTYPIEEYEQLCLFFQNVLEKLSEQIVLKKED